MFASLVLACTLVACEGTPMQPKTAEAAQAQMGPRASVTTNSGTAPSVAITSIRTVVPGLFYAARGLSTDGVQVHIIVRSVSAASGFSTAGSGTLVQDEYRSSGGEMNFSASAGNRYLVTVAPSPGGVDDLANASYVEFKP